RLLDLGADPKATDAFGQTCLHLSFRYSNDNIVSRFLKLKLDISARDKFGMTPLHRACSTDKIRYVKELIRRGAPWDARNNHGHSPLDLAVEAGKISTVKAITSWVKNLGLAHSSDTRRRVRRYLNTALQLACELEHTWIESILLEAGAKIDREKIK